MDRTKSFRQNDEDVALLRVLIWTNDPFQCSILTNSQKTKYVQVVSTTSYAAPKWPHT